MRRIKDYIELLGVVGIIVGIVLVMLQLQQNEQLLRFQIATDLRVNRDNDRLSIRGSQYSSTLAKVQSDLALTPAELIEFNAHAHSIVSELDLRRMLAEAKIFKGDWKNWLVVETCDLFNNKTGRSWLQMQSGYVQINAQIIDKEIIEVITTRMAKCPALFSTVIVDEQSEDD